MASTIAEIIFPYELPANWQWSTLGNVCEYIKADGDKPKDFSKYKTKFCNVPVVANGIINNGIIGYTSKPKEKSGTITMSGRGTICYSVLRDYDYYPIVRVLILSTNEKIFSQYLKFVIDYSSLQGIGSSIQQLTIPMLKKFQIPLPPLDEQKRIVAIIESLFSKLDAAKSIVQKILDGYELRRTAILHKAFTGELTNKKPPIVPISEILEKIFIEPFGTMWHKEEYISGGIPIINPKHISNQKIFLQTTVTISYKKAKMLPSYRLLENDIIMGRRGEMGRIAPVTEKEVGWICGTGSLVLRPPKIILAKFYSQILDSQFCIQYLENVSVGSTMKNLNECVIRNMPVPFFNLAEQKEIVRVLDSLLDKEQSTKEIAEKILSEIDLLKRTILARAFRGELSTNSPSEKLEGLY